jgi:hypothetical protein
MKFKITITDTKPSKEQENNPEILKLIEDRVKL